MRSDVKLAMKDWEEEKDFLLICIYYMQLQLRLKYYSEALFLYRELLFSLVKKLNCQTTNSDLPISKESEV